MTLTKIVAPKKLIEVALPLDAINKACVREKSIRHGHPSTLHLWWARRPLAAARAVLFAQMVNDPAWKYSEEELKKPQVRAAITRKRNELFRLIAELVSWENTTNQEVLDRARAEICASWRETCEANKSHPDAATIFDPGRPPAVHDPFAGGGTIPVEAQRLGLESHATDLNPVAVLINKAMIEIPPLFAGWTPIGPLPPTQKSVAGTQDWPDAMGLAEDIRRYSQWMSDAAEKLIGHLYPKFIVPKDISKTRPDLASYAGRELSVIAWLWARTVASPSPATHGVQVPLVGNFLVSQKPGNSAWVEPVVKGNKYSFVVHTGTPSDPAMVAAGTRTGRGANFRCILSGAPITDGYVKSEASAGRLGWKLLAVVVEGMKGRVYLSPTIEMEAVAHSAAPIWKPDVEFFAQALGFRLGNYGLSKWSELFTPRQTVALDTFAGLVREVRMLATSDAVAKGRVLGKALVDGGRDATAFGDAMGVYTALVVSRLANRQSTNTFWDTAGGMLQQVFARQALPMVWDTAEGNPFSDSSGNFTGQAEYLAKAVTMLPVRPPGSADQCGAASAPVGGRIICTDPPYYDNIGYADLSDFFYVWLRRALGHAMPALFATLTTPKSEELVATPARHGGKKAAEAFFLHGMRDVMRRIADLGNQTAPVTIFYAFKQADTNADGTASTGWETFLAAIVEAGFSVTGTWPVRTEYTGNLKTKRNALASSVVLVCRARGAAEAAVRKTFLRDLARIMPLAIAEMTADPVAAIAPVDLAQACIGPGMALFSKYTAVLEADGAPMSVHDALVHINKAIDEYFAHAEGDLDADSRFCIAWFEQFGFDADEFGKADVLARAKGVSVDGLREAGVVEAGKGKVRLLSIKDLPKKWDPLKDPRTPIWEALHHMCKALGESEGDAGALLAKMPQKEDGIRQLAYRLYTLCAERKKQPELGRPYNELITSWPAIVEASQRMKSKQLGLLG